MYLPCRRWILILCALCALRGEPLRANPPVASYIFPAGGQRGTRVPVRVGGLFLHGDCGFEMLGGGVSVPGRLKQMKTLWFEGPLLPLPDSQRAEDYPRDMAGVINIAPHPALGVCFWRLWTSQGATPSLPFVVGDLPEIVEREIDGDPIPVRVQLPVTINGRIFPREDVDLWTFHAKKGQPVLCEVAAASLGAPLDARLEVLDEHGRVLAENDDDHGPDPRLRFIAPADGTYQVRIRDTQNHGGQAYVYRLTLTSGPHIDYCYPLGGKRGSIVRLELAGQRLPQPHADVKLHAKLGSDFPHALVSGGQKTNTIWLDVDDLPEVREEDAAVKQPVVLPAVLNGRIRTAGEVDAWTWTGKKGDTVEFELRAARLGSRLDGVLVIANAAGKELARAESTGPTPADPRLRFTVPAYGLYTVKVHDRFRSRGGPDFAYRLRAAPPMPDFRLTLTADAITVPRKGQAKLRISAERRGGFNTPIVLRAMGLPPGVTVAPATIPAGQTTVDLTFKADAAAKIRPAHIWITGTANGSARVASLAVPRGHKTHEDVLLMVALPTPFVIKGDYDMGFAARGSVHKRKYKLIRNGYAGPIEVSLTDRQARHLQGVTGPTITVPAGATEFTYAASLPPWMETGRTCRVCVMGVGVLREPDGSLHRVSFSSVNQNEQLVAVVGPGKLALELPRLSFTAKPGQTFAVPVRVKRGLGVKGPVTLDLLVPAHIHGLTAGPATIAAGHDEGELLIRCAAPPPGPLNMPLTVRATLLHQGQPLSAEGKIDVQP